MQAVILAAGEGTRLRPLTRSRPKALVPVANTPILKYVIDALLKNGIREIVVVVGYRKEHVIRYLTEQDLPVRVVVQEKQLGTGHALMCAEPFIRDRFLLLAGDNYIDAASIARIRAERNAVLVTDHPNPSNFGVVVTKDGLIREIKEKPDSPSGLIVSTGIYALDRSFLRYTAEHQEVPDALQAMIRDGTRVVPVRASEWLDAVNPWDLLEMNARLLPQIEARRAGTISRSAKLYGLIRVGKGTEIGPNTFIRGPVIIGEDCRICPNCVIMPNTSIGSRVTIDPLSYVARSLIMDDTAIGSHSRIIDAVVGEACRLQDHTATWTTGAVLERDGGYQKAAFGAVLGDRVCSAPFTVLKNCIVGNNAAISAGNTTVTGVIPDEAVVV